MHRIPVELPERRYEIVLGRGALEETTELLRERTAKPSAIVADETVWKLHGNLMRKVMPDLPLVEVPSGEASKSWGQLERVSEALLKAGVERGGAVVAFGGGVTGDLAGFCAAILRRGCGLIQVPTTLLSQVDSSVGGKTAINTSAGKNLVGAFHQPSLVVIDTGFLETLPRRELQAGYAEIVKVAALGDAEFFAWLEENGSSVLALGDQALEHAVAASCRAKAAIVAADEKERGQRALLNLGHTFGHAIEAEAGFDGRVLHGEAVAAGMAMAARFSAEEGLLPESASMRLETLLCRDGLPTGLSSFADVEFDAPRLLGHMRQDKKVEGGALTLILLRALGDAFVRRGQDAERLLDFLKSEAAHKAP
jgi:3-dehydroquinate synthase